MKIDSTRKREIYEDILKRRGQARITKSQARHLKKVAARKARTEVRREKQEADREASGRLFNEQRPAGADYSVEYLSKTLPRVMSELQESLVSGTTVPWIRSRREILRDLVVWCPIGSRGPEWEALKGLLEVYWDTKGSPEGVEDYVKSILGNHR